jgi:predicted transcriptional regulator
MLYCANRRLHQEALGKTCQEYRPQPVVSRRRSDREYLDVNEWQVAGIKNAIASLDQGKGISHDKVKKWVASWGSAKELPVPQRSMR